MNNIPALNGKSSLFQSAPIDFGSRYFSVYIKATYRDTDFYLRTQLYRNSEGKVQVRGREIGPSRYWVVGKRNAEGDE